MTSDTKFRLALSLLLAALTLLLVRNVVAQGMLGTFPLPRIVGMATKMPSPVTIDVVPKVVLPNTYTTFRVRIRVEPHPDNREYAYNATCGSELRSSIRQIDFVSYTFYDYLTTVADCTFRVCISRLGMKNALCARQEVLTGGI